MCKNSKEKNLKRFQNNIVKDAAFPLILAAYLKGYWAIGDIRIENKSNQILQKRDQTEFIRNIHIIIQNSMFFQLDTQKPMKMQPNIALIRQRTFVRIISKLRVKLSFRP